MSEKQEQQGIVINVLLTKQGVNMGDHAQDVTTIVVADPDETVRSLVERTLTQKVGFREHSSLHAQDDWLLTIRAARPLPNADTSAVEKQGTFDEPPF